MCACAMQQKTIDQQLKHDETTVSNDLIIVMRGLLYISEETPYTNEAITLDLLASSSSSSSSSP